jgi:hypothetical protein
MRQVQRFLRSFGQFIKGATNPTWAHYPLTYRGPFQKVHDHLVCLDGIKALQWLQLYHKPPHEAGNWLDENYPIPGGWSNALVIEAYSLLKEHYPCP